GARGTAVPCGGVAPRGGPQPLAGRSLAALRADPGAAGVRARGDRAEALSPLSHGGHGARRASRPARSGDPSLDPLVRADLPRAAAPLRHRRAVRPRATDRGALRARARAPPFARVSGPARAREPALPGHRRRPDHRPAQAPPGVPLCRHRDRIQPAQDEELGEARSARARDGQGRRRSPLDAGGLLMAIASGYLAAVQDPPFVTSVFHPTAFSEGSHLAFAHALAIALLRETALTILHAGRDFLAEDEWTKFPAVRRTLEAWGCLEPGSPRSAVLEELNVRVKKVNLRSLRPAAAIHEYVTKHDIDLVVLATESGGGLPAWLDHSGSEPGRGGARLMT